MLTGGQLQLKGSLWSVLKSGDLVKLDYVNHCSFSQLSI